MPGRDRAAKTGIGLAQIVAERKTEWHTAGMKFEARSPSLALVAVGALLGVEIFRRNTKHVVTLDANAMQNGLPRRRSFQFVSMRLRRCRFICHGEILAQQQATRQEWHAPGIQLAASCVGIGAS